MASIANVSIRRPVATAMAYLIVVTIGIVGFRYLPVDLLPEIEYARLAVYVNYPNVGPEEMETIITDPLEDALSGVPNLERMTSRSEEGRSMVRLEFPRGTDVAEAANDVRSALDRRRDDLPVEAESPGIWKFDPNAQQIVTLSARSTRDLEGLTRILEREIAQRFEQIPGVGSITIGGGVYREIQVRLRRDRLKAAGLTAEEVWVAIARENVQLPGGNVKVGIRDLYVRTLGEFTSIDEIATTVVANRDGRPIRVRDVAEVVDGYEDVDDLAEMDGVPVVRMEIQKQSGANTVNVARLVREQVRRINADRDDLELTIIQDQSDFIRQSIDSVQSAALWGGLLAVLVLYGFLRNGSTTFIIALSIPISIIATFGLLYFAGLTRRTALCHRRAVLGVSAALVVGALALWPLVPVELTPQMDTNEIDVEMEMARGTNLAVAKNCLDELERLVRPVLLERDLESVSTEVRGDGDAEVEIRLRPAGERTVDPSALADSLRRTVAGRIPGAEVEVDAQSGLWILRRLFSAGGGNEDIEVQLRGYDMDRAARLAQEIRRRMEQTPGIVEARVGQREGRPEENLRFQRAKIYELGLSVNEMARAVQTNVGGSRAGYFREGGDQFPVMVRLRPEDRLTSQDLSNISVKTPEGAMIPVSELVRRDAGRGPTEISHIDG